jgi:hypothetical protein
LLLLVAYCIKMWAFIYKIGRVVINQADRTYFRLTRDQWISV